MLFSLVSWSAAWIECGGSIDERRAVGLQWHHRKMINPQMTVQIIADDIARMIPMAATAYENTPSELEKYRLRGRVGVLLEMILAIDPDLGEMLKADWDARTTSENWTDELRP